MRHQVVSFNLKVSAGCLEVICDEREAESAREGRRKVLGRAEGKKLLGRNDVLITSVMLVREQHLRLGRLSVLLQRSPLTRV